MTNDEKAKLYDRLLAEHSRKAAQVRELETDIRPKPDQQQKIDALKAEMGDLEKRATELSYSAF